MKYKIVVDSCCDLTPEYKNDPHFQIIPLTLMVSGREIVDDETFDQREYLRLVAASAECAHTACPSPQAYMQAITEDTEMVFMVTLSKELSGSYDSAMLGKKLYEEEQAEKGLPAIPVHVFSSDSACCGESLVAFKLQELAESGLTFSEIVEKATVYRDEMLTYFVLDNLDTLKKNGRLTGLAALLATALHIKPIMTSRRGVIIKDDQCRGTQRALQKMVAHFLEKCKNPSDKTVGITHVNCPERAEYVKQLLAASSSFRRIYIVDAAGVATTYANDGGIVLCG